jgi:hypothetical protein
VVALNGSPAPAVDRALTVIIIGLLRHERHAQMVGRKYERTFGSTTWQCTTPSPTLSTTNW